MSVSFQIPCPGMNCANYHPLTFEEVVELLKQTQDYAKKDDWATVNSIHARIDQGIKGMQCPKTRGDAVSEKQDAIGCIFVKDFDKRNASPERIRELAQEIYSLMS